MLIALLVTIHNNREIEKTAKHLQPLSGSSTSCTMSGEARRPGRNASIARLGGGDATFRRQKITKINVFININTDIGIQIYIYLIVYIQVQM